VVGTVTLQWDDARFWGEAGSDGRAGYVHRLAVRRTHAGTGLGALLLSWAADEVLAAGRSRLRLDVVSHNRPLRRYYESVGFTFVRDVTGDWTAANGTPRTWRTSLYERPIDKSAGGSLG
jgi:GNAT superfamily N-acetyltransferase